MISLILPYWKRQAVADAALRQLADTYTDVDLEVIVVDDGDPVPFVAPDLDLDIRIVRLPTKTTPKSPVTAWNAGAKASSGKVMVLSCIEVLHPDPVLKALSSAVRELGPKGYVLAAAWCPEQKAWHCHSSVAVPQCPAGTGIGFCAAMNRSLFFKAGGFDEEYREGAGYEDRDFIHRLHSVGARFVHRDDLVVIHPKTGATINWGDAKFARNQKLFESKWIN